MDAGSLLPNDPRIAEVLARWDRAGPRYTSYPTAPSFSSAFDEPSYRERVRRLAGSQDGAAALYVHLPFCRDACFFCGCNRSIVRDRARIERFVEAVIAEAVLERGLYGPRVIDQLHWGGGSPTWLEPRQRRRLMDGIREAFPIAETAEVSIEADPRHLKAGDVVELRRLGFNRLSLGVQDFDVRVQKAINRIQPEEMTMAAIAEARAAGFEGVSIDLIHGLPHQTTETFAATLNRVAAAAPDRVSVFAYAHMPERFVAQRRIRAQDLPSPAAKRSLLALAAERLIAADYRFIGIDHFALEKDTLTRAADDGSLHRNFQGYSTRAGRDLIGLGASAIGRDAGALWQKCRGIDEWEQGVLRGSLPIEKGVVLDDEDRRRAAAIGAILCNARLDFRAYEERWDVDVPTHFRAELSKLRPLADDGLIEIDDDSLRVTFLGRFVIKSIAGAFDSRTGPDLTPQPRLAG